LVATAAGAAALIAAMLGVWWKAADEDSLPAWSTATADG
jgi:hypothetical protein